MATFDYASYAAAKAAAENKKTQGVKVGFFKLAEGGEALVRFNIPSLDVLQFATIHRVKRTPEDHFAGMSVSCLNPLGKAGECPLCAAADAGDDRVQKVGKRVYVQMLVSYKDKATGTWTAPQPVIWDRSGGYKNGFQIELASKLNTYGDLRQHLFKITRTGTSLDTVYSIDYAVPAVFKPELVPADFSAFENFDITKHSYWVKTAAECEEYLRTSKFPETEKQEQTSANLEKVIPNAEEDAKVEEALGMRPETGPVVTPVVETPKPAETKPAEDTPTRNFGGFSF